MQEEKAVWRDYRFQFKRMARSSEWQPGYRLADDFFAYSLIDFTFWYFYKGEGTLINHQTGKTHTIQAGSALCMKPGMKLETWQSTPNLLRNIYFHFDLYLGDKKIPPENWPEIPFITQVDDPVFYSVTTEHILAILNKAKLPGHHLSVEDRLEAEFLMKSLLMDIFRHSEKSAIGSTSRHHEKVLSETLATMYAEPERFHRVSDLARASGYSPSHFRAICIQVLGQTPNNLLIQARINQAKNLLEHSHFSIGTIADMLGYENVYYFSRQFRMVAGISASEYREKVKKTKPTQL